MIPWRAKSALACAVLGLTIGLTPLSASAARVDEFARSSTGRIGHLARPSSDPSCFPCSPDDNWQWITGDNAAQSNPAAVSFGPGPSLFVAWLRDNRHVDYAITGDGSNFSIGSVDLPSGATDQNGYAMTYSSKPAVASPYPGRYDIFVTGGSLSWTDAIMHMYVDNGNKVGWHMHYGVYHQTVPYPYDVTWPMQAKAKTAPAAVGWPIDGYPWLDVFWVGRSFPSGTEFTLQHAYLDPWNDQLALYETPDSWGRPRDGNGTIADIANDPAVASSADGSMDVVVQMQGRTSTLGHYYWRNYSQGQDVWATAPGMFTSSVYGGPALAAIAPDYFAGAYVADVQGASPPVTPYGWEAMFHAGSWYGGTSSVGISYGVTGIAVCSTP